MPGIISSAGELSLDEAAHCNRIADGVLMGLVLCTLIRAGEALAADSVSIADVRANPGVNVPRPPPSATLVLPAPGLFALPPVMTDTRSFSPTDFRPRKHTLFDTEPAEDGDNAPMLAGTTVWQRMSDYRAHDRVRVLTLWESSGSTVSLQAGRRGGPSLQWTSRLMSRGEATRGVLDKLFSVSLARAGKTLGSVAHSVTTPAPPKSAVMPITR